MSKTKLNKKEDTYYILRIQQGDNSYFDVIYKKYYDRIFAYINKFTQNKELSEDVAQNAFMKAFVAIDSFDYRKGSFNGWMYKIACNEVFYNLKRNYSRQEKEVQSFMQFSHTKEISPIKDYIIIENKEIVKKLLSLLSENQRNCINEFYFNEKSYKEIGELYSISVGSVGTHIFRGIRIISREIEKQEYYGTGNKRTRSC